MDDRTIVETRTRIRAGPGTRLNDLYQIDGLIAVGGMGEVYRGHVIETGDAVAIKTIRPELAENAHALALFRKEAAALFNLHHGAIVRYFVFSIDRRLDLPYLAMEYVTGESLAERLKQGPLDFASLEILRRRLASGLQAAHEAGIVHRDVSPDNVILPGGDPARAKIIDFGIARSSQGGQTVIGDGFAGKYAYVSPEQLGLQGGDVGPKSDIYSLGLVLAEASLGRALDMGAKPADFITRRSVVPDLTGIDPRLAPLLEAMLRPDPALRPDDMAAVAAWEPPVRRAAPQTRPPAGGARRGRVWGGVAAGLALAAGLSLAVLWMPEGGPVPSAPQVLLPEERPPLPREPLPREPISEPAQGSPPQGAQEPSSKPTGAPPPDRQGLDTRPAPVDTPAGPRPDIKPDNKPSPIGSPAPAGPPEAREAPNGAPKPVSPPDTGPPPAPASPTMERVAAFLRGYDGGPCFFLSPVTVGPREAVIEAYGAAAQPFRAFDAAFTAALGFEAKIQLRQVEAPQCPVVELMARQTPLRTAPKLRLDQDRIASGEELRGGLELGEDTPVRLLLVDGDGALHDLAPYLKRTGRQARFSVRLETPPRERGRAPLLVAVTGGDALPAIRPGARAETVFPALLREAARPGSGIGLAVGYVKVGF